MGKFSKIQAVCQYIVYKFSSNDLCYYMITRLFVLSCRSKFFAPFPKGKLYCLLPKFEE